MHHLYQNGTAQLIRVSSTDAQRLSTLTEELGGVRQLMEGRGFNTVVADLKYLMDVTVWVKSNLP